MSAPQHMTALERAQEVRRVRYELKLALRDGRGDVVDVLRGEIPAELERMPADELLLLQPRFGRARARRALLLLGVRENKHLAGAGGLTERQRHRLADIVTRVRTPQRLR